MSEEAATMFDANEASSEPAETQAVETANEGERPDWLLDKFKSSEDQAKAYSDLYGAYSKKTEDLRAEVKEEAAQDYAKSLGVPDDASAYEYPEGFDAPAEGVDQALRGWAKENNVPPEAFKSLISDVYGQTQTNFEAERTKLGDNVDQRVSKLNKWVTSNIDEKHFDAVSKMMTTAQGVELMESMMNKGASRGFAPDDVGTSVQPKPLSRNEIRNLQSDARFGEDEDYTAMVRSRWQAFADQQARS